MGSSDGARPTFSDNAYPSQQYTEKWKSEGTQTESFSTYQSESYHEARTENTSLCRCLSKADAQCMYESLFEQRAPGPDSIETMLATLNLIAVKK